MVGSGGALYCRVIHHFKIDEAQAPELSLYAPYHERALRVPTDLFNLWSTLA